MAETNDDGLCPKCGEAAHVHFCCKPDWIDAPTWQKLTPEERHVVEMRDMTTIYEIVKKAGITFEPEGQGRFGEKGLIVWMHFADEEHDGWNHRLGLRACGDGLQVYDGTSDKSLGYFDLYYQHSPEDGCLTFGRYSQYVIDAVERDEAVGYVKYLPRGTVINFEYNVGVVATDSFAGEFYGCTDEQDALEEVISAASKRRKADEINTRRKKT